MSLLNIDNFLTIFQIKPSFPAPNINEASFKSFVQSIETSVYDMLPNTLLEEACNAEPHQIFSKLYNSLPIITASSLNTFPGSISFSVLSMGKYVHGIGRFIADMLSRWLIPGKQLALDGDRSLMFHFENFESHPLFLCEFFISITDESELIAIQKNLTEFINELRLNILAVYHSRYIVSMRKFSLGERSKLIQENLFPLVNRLSKEGDAFEQMQDFLLKTSTEKKLSQIKENIAYLMQKRPKTFDRDMFDSVYNVSLLFKGKFTLQRDPRHVSRIIGFQYLFKKIIEQSLLNNPKERYLSLKVIKTNSKTVIGILIVFNFLSESERCEKMHLKQAIKACLPQINFVEDSFIVDKSHDKIRCFYLEIEKTDAPPFNKEEIAILRKSLPNEFKDRIENLINPIFMPRNDEEIFRNIIMLSKQLKYVNDIPQVIISYEKQSPKELFFNVILVRLLKSDTLSLKELFSYSQTFLKFSNEEVKTIGFLKKKYPKEVSIFKLSLDKNQFFRKDFTLDLQKARQAVVEEIVKVIGSFRDFNGGFILKQNEVLYNLKQSLLEKDKKDDFLLENFFYSIHPSTMTGILPTNVLESLFLMLLEIVKQPYSKKHFFIKEQNLEKHFLVMVGSDLPNIKEQLCLEINSLNIPSFDLTSSITETDEITTMGYIYRCSSISQRTLFHDTILKALQS